MTVLHFRFEKADALMDGIRSFAIPFGPESIQLQRMLKQLVADLATALNKPLAISEEPTRVLGSIHQAEIVQANQAKNSLANTYCPYFAVLTGLVVVTAIPAEGYKPTYSP